MILRRGYTVSVGKLGDKEIDFVAERRGGRESFQVTYLMADGATRDGICHLQLPKWFLAT